MRFRGLLSKEGMPVIGKLTFKSDGDDWTFEGKFNGKVQLISIGKQTCSLKGMIAIGQHDANGQMCG